MTELAEQKQAGNGALELRADQLWWSEHQIAVLRSAGIDEDVTQPELMAFLHTCQRTGLDPFARQIYLVGRWDSKKTRKVYTPQTSIDGYRVVGQRTCVRTHVALSYEDTLWCGTDGAWTDVWLSSEPPTAAKVALHRGEGRFSAVALWSEYVPLKDGKPMGLWSKMPAVMVAKCAEALALRKAFPNDLSGIYTAEEMAQDSGPSSSSQSSFPAPNPECGKCHFFHRPDGVCPPGQPGPGRNKDGSIDQRKLPKDVKAQRKQTGAAHEALVEEVMGDDKGPERGPVEDLWAGQPAGTLNMPDGSAAKLAKDLLEEVAASVSVEMVEATVAAAREALADERLAFPQLGPIVAAGTARARELTSEQSHGADSVAS